MLCAKRNPDFFRVFIIEHNFKRYLTPEFQHIQPFWFYAPVLLVAFLPWTLLLLWSVVVGSLDSWRKRHISHLATFLLSWSMFCLLFFTASKSKLPGYILPAIPAIGLLLARSYVISAARHRRSLRWAFLGFAVPILLAGFVLIFAKRVLDASQVRAIISAGWVLLAFTVAMLFLGSKKSVERSSFPLASLGVVPILVSLLAFHAVSNSWLPQDPSGRSLAIQIKTLQAMDLPLDDIYTVPMPRGQQYSLNFYMHRPIPGWDPEDPREGFLITKPMDCSRFVRSPWTCSRQPFVLGLTGWVAYRVHKSRATE
jgi:4-amino-4-deoxy-L-arabinose transferase-like glycosyltransferase